MNKREALLQEAADESIEVIQDIPLPQGHKSIYVRSESPVTHTKPEKLQGDTPKTGGPAVIALDPSLTPAEQTTNLAHQLGHHKTGGTNHLTACPLEAERQQHRSAAWSHRHLLPLDDIADAYFQMDQNPFAMAQSLEVTPAFLEAALETWARANERPVKTERYIFQFWPRLRIAKRRIAPRGSAPWTPV